MRKILAVAGFFVFVFVFFLGVSIGDYVYAVELEPIAAMGGITWMENGIKEGHKSFVLIGLKANLKVANDSYVSLMAKGWQMSEPLDEDREIPRKGYGLSSEFNHSIKLEKVKFTPYAGFGFEHWSRKVYAGPFYQWIDGKISGAKTTATGTTSKSINIKADDDFGGLAGVVVDLGKSFELNLEVQQTSKTSIATALTYRF